MFGKKLRLVIAGCALAQLSVGIALLTILISFSPTDAENFQEIYVFGDSLSDVGNVYQATNGKSPPSPPYFQGRYSNGPVWVEYLASQLKLTSNTNNNFAFGGAKTGDSPQLPPGVLAQIQRFQAKHSAADRNAIYLIWAGANDYLGGATDTTVPIANLTNAIKSLSSLGAKKIVVLNLPDLGKLPGTRTTQRANSLSRLTKKHNAELAASIDSLSQKLNPQVNLTYIDVNSLFNRVFTSPQKYGFSNVTQACYSQGIICKNPETYLFWDAIHPATNAHKLLVQLSFPEFKATANNSRKSASNFDIRPIVITFLSLGLGIIIIRGIFAIVSKRR